MSDELLDFGVDLDSIVKRLEGMSYFLSVQDILAATVAIQDEALLPPAAFVSIASETAEPNRTIGGRRQRVNVSVSVLFGEQATRWDRRDRFRMDKTRRAVIVICNGWTPAGAEKALEYDRYLLRGMSAGVAWGEVMFRTSYPLLS